jgi:hypothetical protein
MIPPLDSHYCVTVRRRRKADGSLGYASPSWIREHWPGAKFAIVAGDSDGLGIGYPVGYLTGNQDDLAGWYDDGPLQVFYEVAGFESDDALAALVADPAHLAALLVSPREEVRERTVRALGR